MPVSTNRRAALIPSFVVAGTAVMWGLWWIPLRFLDAHGLSGDWATSDLCARACPGDGDARWAPRHSPNTDRPRPNHIDIQHGLGCLW